MSMNRRRPFGSKYCTVKCGMSEDFQIFKQAQVPAAIYGESLPCARISDVHVIRDTYGRRAGF